MASYTDQIMQNSPYVQQLPLEAMAQVGMYKQQKYEEGVQRIQGQIDKVAGLDIYKDVDKQYLQSKLNELGSKLKTVAAGDFSNFQLVNSVAGMATQVGKDDKVINAVNSTAWYRKQSERIQKDIDEGKSDPSNIYNFQKQANPWLESKEAGAKFNGTYSPHFDVFKFAKETFDAVLPDGHSFDEIYQLGPDGKPLTVKSKDKNGKVTETLVYSPTMTRLEQEGRFPEKVKETLAQIFSDPRVAKQLGITGEYNYKDYNSDALGEKVLQQKNDLLNDYDDKLADLNAKKAKGEDVQNQIDKLIQKREYINSSYDSYIEMAATNPDAVRAELYKDDITTRYTTMFGQIKDKKQVMANPAWNAQFEMQKEANAQSRWAQQLGWDKTKYANDQLWKEKEFNQKWEIAVLGAQKKGILPGQPGYGQGAGPGGLTPEQGNQMSDLDVVHLAEQDYNNAAHGFIDQSAEFIWNSSGFDAIPVNQNRIKSLMSGGKNTRKEAIKIVLNELAERRNMPVEDFMAQYTNKATTTYNNLSPEQKAKNPLLADQYKMFTSAKRDFDGLASVKKTVDAETAKMFGSSVSKDLTMRDIKPQTIQVNGKQYNLSKDDIYDMAVYLKGNLSSFGTLTNDEGANSAAKSAEARLAARGNGELIDDLLSSKILNRAYRGGPLTFAVSAAKGLFGLKEAWKGLRHPGDTDDPYGQVGKVFDLIDNDQYTGAIKGKAAIIKNAYGMKPNLKVGLMTGDAETDRQTLYNISRWAGEYGTKAGEKLNVSPDFEGFRSGLNEDPSKNTFSAQTIIDQNGMPQIEVVLYDPKDKKRLGGMTIQPDEAAKINLNVNNLYEPKSISILRNKINFNDGKTSAGNPSDKTTYTQGDVYFDDGDFNNLRNSGFSAKGNIVYSNGMYYPFVYVQDGNGSKVRQLPGDPDLQVCVSRIKGLDPTLAKKILIEK